MRSHRGLNSALPNQRLKLTARGGRVIGKGSVLIAAAVGAGRSTSDLRSAPPAAPSSILASFSVGAPRLRSRTGESLS